MDKNTAEKELYDIRRAIEDSLNQKGLMDKEYAEIERVMKLSIDEALQGGGAWPSQDRSPSDRSRNGHYINHVPRGHPLRIDPGILHGGRHMGQNSPQYSDVVRKDHKGRNPDRGIHTSPTPDNLNYNVMCMKLRNSFGIPNINVHDMKPDGHCLYSTFSAFGNVKTCRMIDAEHYNNEVAHGLNGQRLKTAIDRKLCLNGDGTLQDCALQSSWGDEYTRQALSRAFGINLITVSFDPIRPGELAFEVYSNEKINGKLVSHLNQGIQQFEEARVYMKSPFMVIGMVDSHYCRFDGFNVRWG
jgi:hypothetical protein